MSLYGTVFAQIYDPFLAWGERAGLRALRGEVLSRAAGSVLEIGAGTGLNLPHYPPSVTSLALADPEPPMVRRLERAGAADRRSPAVTLAPAEQLPFDDEHFDAVVSTLVLCTVDDPARALGEIRRVLRPGGRLLFIEHVRSEDPTLSRWQDRLHRPWHSFGYGCHCNRDTRAEMLSAGFDVTDLQRARWRRMPAIVAPLIAGTAVRADAAAA